MINSIEENDIVIRVDVWHGKHHQSLKESRNFDDWKEVFSFIEEAVEMGYLINVVCMSAIANL